MATIGGYISVISIKGNKKQSPKIRVGRMLTLAPPRFALA